MIAFFSNIQERILGVWLGIAKAQEQSKRMAVCSQYISLFEPEQLRCSFYWLHPVRYLTEYLHRPYRTTLATVPAYPNNFLVGQ